MQYATILVDQADGIATLTMNRPDKFNAMSQEMVFEMIDACERFSRDDTVRVVVFTGAGRAFSAGGDIDWLRRTAEERRAGRHAVDAMRPEDSTRFCLALRGIPQPTIASINGVAAGGGITAALNCDIRIAAEEASISFPFVPAVAIAPELGSTYLLPRLVGIAKACELMLTGGPVSGTEAKSIRLVNEAVPLAELQTTTTAMARSIARASPHAVRLSKAGLYQGMAADLYNQLMWEEEALRATFGSEDNEEAIRAFLEKRTPVFRSRR